MFRRGFSPFACVFSRGSTTERFFPTSIAVPTSAVKAVRAMMEVLNLTADLRLKFAFQESDDREVWPATFTLLAGSGTNVDGYFPGDTYETLTLTKAWVRFGVVTKNDSAGTKYEFAWVSMRFDTRAC